MGEMMTDYTDEANIRRAARRLVDEFDLMAPSAAKIALAQELFGKDWLDVMERLDKARTEYETSTSRAAANIGSA